jgi:predicted transcriptional regulator
MEISQIFQELHTCGISNTEIANYLGVSPASITLISQGKRSGEKHKQKLLILLEQQRAKYKSLVEYETSKTERSLEQILTKTDWELAHNQGKDRIQELAEAKKWLKEWEQELRAACRLLGIRYPVGYKPNGNGEEQKIVKLAHARRIQITRARQNVALEMTELKHQAVNSYFPTEVSVIESVPVSPMLIGPSQHVIRYCNRCLENIKGEVYEVPAKNPTYGHLYDYYCKKCEWEIRQQIQAQKQLKSPR